MDGARFDRVAKKLSLRLSRRQAVPVAAAGVAGVAGLATGGVSAQLAATAKSTRLDFPGSCRYFQISGSRRKIREDFNYDDDMTIKLIRGNGTRRKLLNDKDGEIGVGGKDVPPIKFQAEDGDELVIVARDGQPCCYSLEKMFLHCCTNKRCKKSREAKRLTKGVKRTEPKNWKKRVFFRETFDIRIG